MCILNLFTKRKLINVKFVQNLFLRKVACNFIFVQSTKNKPFVCIECGKSFGSSSNIKPDIVAFNKETRRVLIADSSIVAVSRDLEEAKRDKQLKYNTPEVVKWIKAKYGKETSIEVCGLILD